MVYRARDQNTGTMPVADGGKTVQEIKVAYSISLFLGLLFLVFLGLLFIPAFYESLKIRMMFWSGEKKYLVAGLTIITIALLVGCKYLI